HGMGGEVSTNGDVYSYGILLLEMFTGRRPTDHMFKDGFSLHTFVKTSLVPTRILQIIDSKLLLSLHLQDNSDSDADELDCNGKVSINGEMEAKLQEALTGILKLGIACSFVAPKERMKMTQVLKELRSIENAHLLEFSLGK
ncbi:hypothetical protein MKW94_015736, partial [Papaver nudicaule]|nr:hypothetical protein [Papaver nudicaule]